MSLIANSSVRAAIVAVQFLTRLPTPRLPDFRDDDLARAAVWFPGVGLLIGVVVASALFLPFGLRATLGPLVLLLLWVWITGALHLDGLADTADGLGAMHAKPERFLEVARDPNVGAFGVVAMVLVLLAKFWALVVIATQPIIGASAGLLVLVATVALIPAWARWVGCLAALRLPALGAGGGMAFKAGLSAPQVAIAGGTLALVSSAIAPVLLVAPVIGFVLIQFFRRRLNGMSGDVLGAVIEVTECILLLAVAAMMPVVIQGLR